MNFSKAFSLTGFYMSDEKLKNKHTLLLSMDSEIYDLFLNESNKSALVSDLLTRYYKNKKEGNNILLDNEDYVFFKIDDRIKEQYNNDIYKNLRPQMLLTEFYTNIAPNSLRDIEQAKLERRNCENIIDKDKLSDEEHISTELKEEINDNINPVEESKNDSVITENQSKDAEKVVEIETGELADKNYQRENNEEDIQEKSNSLDVNEDKKSTLIEDKRRESKNEDKSEEDTYSNAEKKVQVVNEGSLDSIISINKNILKR